MSDKELYALAKRFGEEALAARRKFAGLLPEVARRRLYEKKGYSCLYEFAAKLVGMSRDLVNTVLRLDQKFEDKPVLHEALIEGKISANKLVRIASIATTENQEELATKIETLSNRAVEVFVQDYKIEKGLQKPERVLHVQTLQLDSDVQEKLIELQQKGININEILRNALQQREQTIAKEKEELSRQERQKDQDRTLIGYPNSRHMPAKVERVIKAEYGTKCSEPGCHKPAEHIHHENLFSKSHSHDPMHLKPLCKGHHELAHAGEIRYEKRRH